MTFKYWKPSEQKPWPIRTASKLFVSTVRLLFAPYQRFGLRIRKVKFINADSFFNCFRDSLENRSRFVIAFRHPGDVDTHVLYASFTNLILPYARKAGIKQIPYPVFLAGADITFWLDAFGNFILRKTGAIPVKHGLPDRKTMDAIITLIANNPNPVVLAPEGQVTYHCGKVSDLDLGVFNLTYMAREKTSPRLPVKILPLAVEYDFGSGKKNEWKKFDQFVRGLETDIGLKATQDLSRQQSLIRIWEHLVEKAEDYYSLNHHAVFDKSLDLYSRHYKVQEQAISVVEGWFGIKSSDTQINRIFALRTHIYQVMSSPEPETLSHLSRIMRDKKAAELWFVNRHQELADLMVHLHPDYICETSSFSKYVEVLHNLYDFANRLEGGTIGQRKKLFLRTITIRFSSAFNLPEGKRREVVVQGAEILKKSLEELTKYFT